MGQPGSPEVVQQVVPVDKNGNDLDNVVVASTGQAGVVYQPGATYPNGSNWSGNRCNNLSSLLTKCQAMFGARVVNVDLSLVSDAQTISSGALLNFGGDVLLVGVRNPTNGALPALTFDSNTRISPVGRIEVRDLAVNVASSNTAPLIALDSTHKIEVVVSGESQIVSKGTGVEFVRSSVTGQTVILRDLATFPHGQGDAGGTFESIKATTGSITAQCFGAATVAAGTVDTSCFLDVRAPGVAVDSSFGAKINLFPGVQYVASGTPGSVGVTATAPGCVYLDDSTGTGYYWSGSAWVAQSGGGGGFVPSGTGFYHVTGGVADSAARAVALGSADVSGTLAAANQAAQTLGGQLSGTTAAGTVTNATMAAGTVPNLGSGADGESLDGTSGTYIERQANWVALTGGGGAQTVYTLPNSIPGGSSGGVATIVAEVHLTKDGDGSAAAFGYFTQRAVVRNVSGTLTNTTGGQTDVPQATNNLGTSLAGSTCAIDVTTNPPTIKVTPPASGSYHARVAVVDVYFGTSGV